MYIDLIKVKNDYENVWGNLNIEVVMLSQCGCSDILFFIGCYKI